MIKIIFLILTTINISYADNRPVSENHKKQYCPKSDNWHFHCDPDKEKKKEEEKMQEKINQNNANNKEVTPMDVVKQRRIDYENAHADFLLDPNDEQKGLKYLRARQKMLKDVSLAVAKEQEIKWKYGDLNISI